MAVLQKIRGWGIWLSLIIAFALLLFLVDPSVVSRLFGQGMQKETYGYIAGEEVTNEEFYEITQKYRFPDREEGYHNAWGMIVYNRLLSPWVEKAGVRVTEEQAEEMLADYPEEYIAYYGRDFLREQILQGKTLSQYTQLFYQSAYPNGAYLDRAYADANLNTTVNMISVAAPVDEIEVSDDELRAAYNARKYGWAPRSSEVEYINIHVYPSESDMAAATEKYTAAYDEFCSTENVGSFLRRNSDENSKAVRFYKQGELPEELDALVFGQGQNQTEILSSGYDMTSARVLSSGMRSASGHVDVYAFLDETKADSLLALLNGGKETMENLRANHEVSYFGKFPVSRNKTSIDIPDEMGGVTPVDLGADFLESPVGKYMTKERYGSSFVYALTDKEQPALLKEVAVYAKHVLPSKATYQEVSDSVAMFYANAQTLDKLPEAGARFAEMASVYDVTVLDTVTVYRTLEGPVGNLKNSITRTVFSTNPGTVFMTSNATTNDLFLVGVKSHRAEGSASFDEVKESLRRELQVRKAAETRLAALREEVKGAADFAAIAAQLGETPVQRVISYDDPRLVGAVRATEAGQVGMIDGLDGNVYVFEVVESSLRNTTEKDNLRNNYWRSQSLRNLQQEPINFVLRLNGVTSYLDRIF